MKKILIVTASLIGLGVVVIGFILVPPHLQIRRIEPALPSLAELKKLVPAEQGPISISYINTSSQRFGDRVSGNSVFLIKWQDGRMFMVDAGMDKKAATEFGEQAQSWLGATEPVNYRSFAAQALGEEIRNVQGVGFTHLHMDHVQGLQSFCERRGAGAKVYQTAIQASVHNLRTEEGAEIVRKSCLATVVVEGEGLQQLSDFPGIAILNVGGHTPGSTIFFVTVGKKLWVLAGDVSSSKQDMLNNKGEGFFYSYLLVPENTRQLEKLRVWLTVLDADPNVEVLISHDAENLAASKIEKWGLKPRL